MRPFLGSILTLALAGSALAQVDITTCGTTVPAHQVGTLQNDLVCTGIGVGVVLEHKATLQLNGHTIGGTFDWDGFSVENGCVVQALDAATIVGPGEITGTAVWAVVQSRGRRLDLANLTIRDSNVPGVGMGGSSKGDLRLRNVTILRVLDGIVGRNVTLEDVTIADAVVRGIASIGRVRGKNVTLTNNGLFGIENITPGAAKITGLTCTGHTGAGLHVYRARLRDSTVTGNALDLVTGSRPMLANTACDASRTWEGSANWGVCAND